MDICFIDWTTNPWQYGSKRRSSGSLNASITGFPHKFSTDQRTPALEMTGFVCRPITAWASPGNWPYKPTYSDAR